MKPAPTASVIVCTKNRMDVLSENVESLLHQSAEDYEVIYVDDGSTDATAETIREYAGRSEGRIRLVQTEGVGPGRARNAGARVAEGKFFLFIDDDARASTTWIEDMLRRQEEHGCDLLCGGIDAHSMSGKVERYLHYRMQSALGASAKGIKAGPTGNMLITRAAFESVDGFRDEFLPAAEDWDLCLRLRATGAKLYYDPLPMVTHRYHVELSGALARLRAAAGSGVYIAREHYGSVFAYVCFSVARGLVAPFWVPRYYPRDLYFFAVRMELSIALHRVAAYLRGSKGPVR